MSTCRKVKPAEITHWWKPRTRHCAPVSVSAAGRAVVIIIISARPKSFNQRQAAALHGSACCYLTGGFRGLATDWCPLQLHGWLHARVFNVSKLVDATQSWRWRCRSIPRLRFCSGFIICLLPFINYTLFFHMAVSRTDWNSPPGANFSECYPLMTRSTKLSDCILYAVWSARFDLAIIVIHWFCAIIWTGNRLSCKTPFPALKLLLMFLPIWAGLRHVNGTQQSTSLTQTTSTD